MEATTVIILALLGIVAGRNILPQEDDNYLQLIEELSRYPAPTTEGEETVSALQPEPLAKENIIDNKILDLIFKDFYYKPTAYEELVIADTRNAENEADVSPVEIGDADEKMDVGDRNWISVDTCPDGKVRIGEHCDPVDED